MTITPTAGKAGSDRYLYMVATWSAENGCRRQAPLLFTRLFSGGALGNGSEKIVVSQLAVDFLVNIVAFTPSLTAATYEFIRASAFAAVASISATSSMPPAACEAMPNSL